jgi:hypothetical protein
MPLVTIKTNPLAGTASVVSPYSPERVAIIKETPGRTWNQTGKTWTIPIDCVEHLKYRLELNGDKVTVLGSTGTSSGGGGDAAALAAQVATLIAENSRLKQQLRSAKATGAAGSQTWEEKMFATLSPELGEKVFKALTRALHPDGGGDTAAMASLNRARDLINGVNVGMRR